MTSMAHCPWLMFVARVATAVGLVGATPSRLAAQVGPTVSGGAGCLTPVLLLGLPAMLLWQIANTAVAALTRRRASSTLITFTWASGLVGAGVGTLLCAWFLLLGVSEAPNFFEWLALALLAVSVLGLLVIRRPPGETGAAPSKRRRRLTLALAMLCALFLLAALVRLYIDLEEEEVFWREYVARPPS